jgi:ferredoxin--NADP+ reductase
LIVSGYRILSHRLLATRIHEYWVETPLIARKHRAGQFVIVRLHDHGERIPLTVVSTLPEEGVIRLIVQEAGKSTMEMSGYNEGDSFLDVVGPLGMATHLQQWGRLVVIGGGVGSAPLLPIAKAARAAGNHVSAILGARSKEFLILTDEFTACCDAVRVCTDDGSVGEHGLVTEALRRWVAAGEHFDYSILVGPVIMMQAAAIATRELGIPGQASLNPIMVDGTGMCGACRVTVHGQTRFACVDGPEFDAHGVDFNELIQRNKSYRRQEAQAADRLREHECEMARLGITDHV